MLKTMYSNFEVVIEDLFLLPNNNNNNNNNNNDN